MNMRLKWILRSEVEFQEYMNKLDYVENGVIFHQGKPSKYPVLVVTDRTDDQISSPIWEHSFIYASQIDDLRAIYDKIRHDESLTDMYKRYMGDANLPPAKDVAKIESEEKKEEKKEVKKEFDKELLELAKWNDFWDELETNIRVAGMSLVDTDKEEEADVMEIQSLLYKSPYEARKKIHDYMDRWWPGGLYLEAVRSWLRTLSMNDRGYGAIPPGVTFGRKEVRFGISL